MEYAFAALASFVLSTAFVAITLYLALKNSWYDHHDERKIHTGMVPRIGGIGFASAFILVAISLTLFTNHRSGASAVSLGPRFIPALIAMVLILAFGVVDDFRPLRPRYKLIVQSLAAILVLASGFSFHHTAFSALNFNLEFGFWRFPITFIWIVGVTNAINLLDGVDGLAGGVSALAALTFGIIYALLGNSSAAILCLALAAAVGGFLVFNLPLPKARLFMGDGGSQFLGFMLAVLPLLNDNHGLASIPIPFAAAVLSLPIFDTFAAIWRRTREGRRIDSPDKAHMHHKLMNLGLRSRGVDGVAYTLQILIGLLIIASIYTGSWQGLFLLATAYAVPILFFAFLHYRNRRVNLSRSNPAS